MAKLRSLGWQIRQGCSPSPATNVPIQILDMIHMILLLLSSASLSHSFVAACTEPLAGCLVSSGLSSSNSGGSGADRIGTGVWLFAMPMADTKSLYLDARNGIQRKGKNV